MANNEKMVKRIVDIFKRKTEISLNKDILPIILDEYFGFPVDRVTTEMMNQYIMVAMNEVRDKDISYMSYPKFEKTGLEIAVTDVIYTRLPIKWLY